MKPDKLIICLLRFGETVADLYAALSLAGVSKEGNELHVVIVTTGGNAKQRAENLCQLVVGDHYEVLYAPEGTSWDWHPDYPNTSDRLWTQQEWYPELCPAYKALPMIGQCQPVGTRLTQLLSECSPDHPAKVCVCAPLAAHRLIPKALTAHAKWYVTPSHCNLLLNPDILQEFRQRLLQFNQVARMVHCGERDLHLHWYNNNQLELSQRTPIHAGFIAEVTRLLPPGPIEGDADWAHTPALDSMTVGLAIDDCAQLQRPSYKIGTRGYYDHALQFHESANEPFAKVEFDFAPHGDVLFLCFIRATSVVF
jgi:hypothetical protein